MIGNGQVSGDGSALSAPVAWTLDPEDPTRMLVATCRVWRGAADGTDWSAGNALSRMLDGNNAPACQSSNTQVRALAATGAISGRGDNAERIYVGLAGTPDGAMTHPGHVLTALVTPSSVAGSTTWSDVTGSPVTNDPRIRRSSTGRWWGSRRSSWIHGHDGEDGICRDCRIWRTGIRAASAGRMCRCSTAARTVGATWQNLTNNLPNAPVNAVLVDPEDPAIVYVGTDVGVYVTTSITQCIDVKQNCWSAYGDWTAGGAGDDAERRGYEWGEVAAGGNERPWRVAGASWPARR